VVFPFTFIRPEGGALAFEATRMGIQGSLSRKCNADDDDISHMSSSSLIAFYSFYRDLWQPALCAGLVGTEPVYKLV
jgi:hypothetical protein